MAIGPVERAAGQAFAVWSHWKPSGSFGVDSARHIADWSGKKASARAGGCREAGAPATGLDRIQGLDEVVDQSVAEIEDILTRPQEDLDHARALEGGIEYRGKLDDLLNKTVLRRNDALRQVQMYREGLGRHLLLVSDTMIDAMCEDVTLQSRQVEATLIPSSE